MIHILLAMRAALSAARGAQALITVVAAEATRHYLGAGLTGAGAFLASYFSTIFAKSSARVPDAPWLRKG